MGERQPPAPPLVGIVGPTASGKSELAAALAERLPLEVLVADSRQVYRGMDVGTATPSLAERARIPHHLLDLVDPDRPFTVADWVERARAVLPEVAARGRLPMLVGGTGLYVSALVDGHDYVAQAWSPEVRHGLEARLSRHGLAPLAIELHERDPAAAGRIDLQNPRRVLRALERAIVGDGGPAPRSEPYPGRVALLGIARPREELIRRIEARARWMFTEGGLLDEVRALVDRGFGPDLRPMSGHGYREAAAHLEGRMTLDAAIELTARRTRQYARRQMTWFRREGRIVWLPAGDGPASAREIVDRAERILRAAIS